MKIVQQSSLENRFKNGLWFSCKNWTQHIDKSIEHKLIFVDEIMKSLKNRKINAMPVLSYLTVSFGTKRETGEQDWDGNWETRHPEEGAGGRGEVVVGGKTYLEQIEY